MPTRRRLSALLALLYCSVTLVANIACDRCLGEEVKTIDLRTRVDPSRCYYVILCVRESEPYGPGHAFVVWVEQLPDGRVIDAHGCGFYPPLEQGLLMVLLGPGVTDDESNRPASVIPQLLTHRLVCCVDRAGYYRSRETHDRWLRKRYNYNLLTRNCTHFAHTIATAAGIHLSAPRFCECPADYLGRLIRTAK